MKANIRDYINARVLEVAEHVLETKDDVRSTAKIFGVSKSTIHKDLTERLSVINPELRSQIKIILIDNKYLGELKGGKTTAQRSKKWKIQN